MIDVNNAKSIATIIFEGSGAKINLPLYSFTRGIFFDWHHYVNALL